MSRKPTNDQLAMYNNLREEYRRIVDYTDKELDAAIAVLGYMHPDAWEILNFVDAYFERRKRKDKEGKY